MGLKIEDFKSIVKDVARPNRFMVYVLPNPSVFEPVGKKSLMSTISNIAMGARFLLGNPRSLFYLVKEVSLPERSFNTLEHKRLGVTRKVAGDASYDDLTVTFLNDTSYSIRSLMDAWHENIIHQGSKCRI